MSWRTLAADSERSNQGNASKGVRGIPQPASGRGGRRCPRARKNAPVSGESPGTGSRLGGDSTRAKASFFGGPRGRDPRALRTARCSAWKRRQGVQTRRHEKVYRPGHTSDHEENPSGVPGRIPQSLSRSGCETKTGCETKRAERRRRPAPGRTEEGQNDPYSVHSRVRFMSPRPPSGRLPEAGCCSV